MKRIDLHVHTTASDGSLTPSEAVCHANALGLSAIAITDHDTCAGVREALAAANTVGIEVIPGIEISVNYQGLGVHVLGYFIDSDSSAIKRSLAWINDERTQRNRVMADALLADGIDIHLDEIQANNPESVISRPHFAAELVKLGLAVSIRDAFDRYIGIGQKYFRPREYFPIQDAFDIIREAGGKAVLAHPLQYRLEEPDLQRMIKTMKDAGAVGLECLYYGYRPERMAYLQKLATKYDLCVTGGSDYHGSGKPEIEMGVPTISYDLLEVFRSL